MPATTNDGATYLNSGMAEGVWVRTTAVDATGTATVREIRLENGKSLGLSLAGVPEAIDPPATVSAWGSISGLIDSQLDLTAVRDGLQNQINTKQASGSYAAASHGHAPEDIAGTAVINTDARLSNARTPTSHAASHAPGGADAIVPSTTTSVPTTGQTTTFNTGKLHQSHALLHSATIAAHTVVIPSEANSAIGQELRLFSKSIVTTLTTTLNGNTIHGAALTTLAAGANVGWRKVAASTWVRMQ